MKRRVIQGKENKRCHKTLHAAFNAKPPFLVIVDASAVRAFAELKGVPNGLATTIEDGIEADVDLRFVPPTRRVIRKTAPEAERHLEGKIAEYAVAGTSEEQNEVKAIVQALQMPRTGRYPVVFVLSLSHDVRKAAANVPAVGLLNLVLKEKRVHFDADAIHALSRGGTAAATGASPAAAPGQTTLSPADAAFLRKLAADRLIKDSAVPLAARRRSAAPAAEAPQQSPAATVAAKAREAALGKRHRRQQAKKTFVNPLAKKKKKQKLTYHASNPCD